MSVLGTGNWGRTEANGCWERHLTPFAHWVLPWSPLLPCLVSSLFVFSPLLCLGLRGEPVLVAMVTVVIVITMQCHLYHSVLSPSPSLWAHIKDRVHLIVFSFLFGLNWGLFARLFIQMWVCQCMLDMYMTLRVRHTLCLSVSPDPVECGLACDVILVLLA